MDTTNLLSVHDVAIRLSLSEDTVLHFAREGTLPSSQIENTYWFRPEDVAAYNNEHPDPDPPVDGGVTKLVREPTDTTDSVR